MKEELLPEGGLVDVCLSAPSQVTETSEPKKEKAPRLAVKDMSPERQREYNRKKTEKSRARKAANAEMSARKADCQEEVSRKASKEILAERGIVNQHCMDTLFDLAEAVARANKIPLNDHLLRHGLQSTLAVLDGSDLPPAPEIKEVPGELINQVELNAIYDLTEFSQFNAPISYEEFLRLRRLCKTDAYELGLLLEKDFDSIHKTWSEFFPRWDPTTLNASYTQRQMREWIDAQTPIKDFLLMASRNSLKSSFIIIWALTLTLCAPDARLLLVSETQKLSKGFLRSFRSYWEIKPGQKTKLQILFPEYCISVSEGSALIFDSPMAHLSLIQSSAEATSLESTVAGNRADCIIFDDPISNLSTGNDVQIQASIDKWDLLTKLREVGSPVITIGTPWAPTDLYATQLKRNEADENKSLAWRIDPAFIVKPESRFKELLDLREDDIESFLLPARLTWKFLRKEMVANPTFFKSQNLCQFVPSEEDLLKVTFTEEELRARVRPLSSFNTALTQQTVIAVDTSNFSASRFADFCCITTAKILKNEGKDIVVVTDVKLERYKMSECAAAIVEQIHAANSNNALIEKTGAYEELALQIRKAAALRGYVLPFIYWKSGNLGNVKFAKTRRIKSLEPMIAESKLFWTPGPWNDAVFAQFVKFDGITKSSSTRFDDAPDCLALLVEAYYPRQVGEPEKTPHQREVEEAAMKAAREDAMLRQQYARYFGTQSSLQPRQPEFEEEGVESPLFRGAGSVLKRR
jgi:hypothetical protein